MRRLALPLATLLAATAPASAQTLDTLFSFSGLTGRNPYAGVTLDAAGNLFGTTYQGAGYGTVFRLSPDGLGGYSHSILLSLTNGTGIYPTAGVALDAAGNVFGAGNTGGPGGGGTLFRLSPDGAGGYVHSNLVNFAGANGRNPYARLTPGASGNFFGTTYLGGSSNNGTVFSLSPNGLGGYTHSTIMSFDSANGRNPVSELIVDTLGNIFGTTYNGSRVFRLSPDGAGGYTHSTIFTLSFANGVNPAGRLTLDNAGNLFGTTYSGGPNNGGTVFRLSPDGAGGYTHSTLFAFPQSGDGRNPNAGLLLDAAGNLFGTTTYGGGAGVGTIYRLSPDGVGGYIHTTLFSLTDGTGVYPYGELASDQDGNIYGTTSDWGPSGYGTVFRLSNAGFVVASNEVPTATPEPASLAILSLAAFSLAAARRRRPAAA